MSIIHIPDNIKEEFKVSADGKAFVSIYGAALLLDVDRRGLARNCNRDQIDSKFAQYLAEWGFQIGDLDEKGISDVMLAPIVKYYAYHAQKKSKQAQLLDMAFSAIGIRTWVQSELGYQPQLEQKKPRSMYDLTELELCRLIFALESYDEKDRQFLRKDIEPEFWSLPSIVLQRLALMTKIDYMVETALIRAKADAKSVAEAFKVREKGFGGPNRLQVYDAALQTCEKQVLDEIAQLNEVILDPAAISACEEFEQLIAANRIEAAKQASLAD